MSTPRYLVTGGAGFIGSNLVAALDAPPASASASSATSRPARWEHLDGLPTSR